MRSLNIEDVNAALALALSLEAMEFPEGTRLRGAREGTWVTEPGKEPYLLPTMGGVANDPL